MANVHDRDRPHGSIGAVAGQPSNQSEASSTSQNVSALSESDARLQVLLNQQAQIQADIKALLPPKSVLNTRRELSMLNHKHEILRFCHEGSGLVPLILSEEEECRVLQYKCECLEATCLQSGKYSSVDDLVESGSLHLKSFQPSGFEDWFRINAVEYDPILRHIPASSAPGQFRTSFSFKCSELKCIHYIYGFDSLERLEDHKQQQHMSSKGLGSSTKPQINSPPTRVEQRQSFLSPPQTMSRQTSLAAAPREPFSDPSHSRWEGWESPAVLSRNIHAGNSNTPLPMSRWHNAPSRMPPVAQKNFEQAPSNSTLTYSFIPEYSTFDEKMEKSLETSSRPAKRARLTTDYPENSKLMREIGSCLRCKILKKKCDTSDPCSLCPEQDSLAEGDYWKVLGCHRGSLVSFAEILVPDGGSPPYLHTPVSLSDQIDGTSKTSANEWWHNSQSERRQNSIESTELRDEFGCLWLQPDDIPPPYIILSQTTGSSDSSPTAYNLLSLFKFTAKLSGSRTIERQRFPILSLSKQLHQEAFIFEVSHDATPIIPGTLASKYHRYSILHQHASDFISLFDSMTLRRSAWDSKDWLATFSSLIFLHATICLLDNGFFKVKKQGFLWDQAAETALHAVYKALASIFLWSTSSLLDDEPASMSSEDALLLLELKKVILRERWSDCGILSTKDFLMGLDSGSVMGGFSQGFGPQHHSLQTNPPASTIPEIELIEPGSKSSSRQRVAAHFEATALSNFNNTQPLSDDVVAAAKPMYQRSKQDRLYCKSCDDHPEGFRGEHELRRHTDRSHNSTIKKWICVTPNSNNHPQPEMALSQCKSCLLPKKYGAYYNAAAHLRRSHFTPKARSKSKGEGRRGGKGGGDWPPMSELKHWMEQVEEAAGDNIAIVSEDVVDDDDNDDDPPSIPGRWKGNSYSAYSSAFPNKTVANFNLDNCPPILLSVEPPPGHLNRRGNVPIPELDRPELDRCPYPDCRKSFTDLKAHMLTHQSERPVKCPVLTCDYHTKGFARRYDKNRHTLTHYKGIIVCPFCPGVGTPAEKTFSRADVMKRHLTSVHGVDQAPSNMRKASVATGKKGKCSICGREFEGAQTYYEHLDDCVLAVVAPIAMAEG